jgi:hypothetical protein
VKLIASSSGERETMVVRRRRGRVRAVVVLEDGNMIDERVRIESESEWVQSSMVEALTQ